MTVPFTPEQEARVREIIAEMLSTALRGADQRIAELVSGSVLLLPLHSMLGTTSEAQPSAGKASDPTAEWTA